ncbi:unnamed protein product [Rhizoctonia solani]|nr:unnamed protein product [Rhizoctonia solani]
MIKLTDFGNGILNEYELKFSNTTAINATLISRRWAAPEIIANGIKATFETDVLTTHQKTILEIISGSMPYKGLDEFVACSNIINGIHPLRPEDSIPTESQHGDALWSTLKKCWAFDPDERPIAVDIRDEMLGITPKDLLAPSIH